MQTPAHKFIALLSEFKSNPAPDTDHYSRVLKKVLLDFGSETPDNLSAVKLVDVGAFKYTQLEQNGGLRLAITQTALTDVLNALEGAPIPAQLKEAMPTLTQAEFDAVLRVAVLTLAAFENQAAGNSGLVNTDEAR